jgi:hypothetical protein
VAVTTDVLEQFRARYGAPLTIADAKWFRKEKFAEAEVLVEQIEAAESKRGSRTELAALRSDFDRVLDEIREIDRVTGEYLDRRDDKWRRMLRAAYGYVPGV